MIKYKANTSLIESWITNQFPSRALARAANGRLWLAYPSEWTPPAEFIFAAYSDDNGVTWTEEIVYGPVANLPIGDRIYLVIDSLSLPHIIFAIAGGGGSPRYIMHTVRVAGVWSVPDLVYDSGLAVIFDKSTCIDTTNVIHIAQTSNADVILHHIWGTTGSWNREDAYDATLNGLGSNVEIATDSLNNIFMVWGEGLGLLRTIAVYRTGGLWLGVPEVVSAANGWDISISFDPADNLHAAWLGPGVWADCARYAMRTPLPGAWGVVINAIDDFDDIVNCITPTITIDTDGNAYIIIQTDNHGVDETVYYKKITGGVVGALMVLDAAILMPNACSSVYTSLWSGSSNSSIISSGFYPIAILLDEDNSTGILLANAYFEALAVVKGIKGNPNVDQLMYQHVERMRR